MNRVQSILEPPQFVETVVLAFKEVQETYLPSPIGDRFRSERSFEQFQEGLRVATDVAGSDHSILVLGCGRGFAGESTQFAVDAVQEIVSSTDWTIDTRDLTPATFGVSLDTLFTSGDFAECRNNYDLVVTHSLVHFMPSLDAFFGLVRSLLKPSGALVVGHEPNAEFWRNQQCQLAVNEWRRARRRRGWRERLKVIPIVRRLGRRDSVQVLADRVNQRLRDEYGFKADLTRSEISRLVDIHRPEATPGGFRIGFDGFDHEELTRTYLPGFALTWIKTSAHLGYASATSLSDEWSRREVELAEAFPLAGSVLNACWRRTLLA